MPVANRSQQKRISALRFILVASLCCLPVGIAQAQKNAPQAKPAAKNGKPAAKSSSLDDALLEDLDNDLLDGVKDLPVKKKLGPTGDKPPADARSPDDPEDPAGEDGDGEMAEDAPSPDEEPLIRIGQQMRTAEKRIERGRSPEKTQELQGQILNDLAELIKKLEEQSQNQSSSSSNSSKSQQQQTASREQVKQPKSGGGKGGAQANNQPAKESTERLGKNNTQKPDGDAVKGLLKDAWGQLPPHARQQMLQSPPEEFLPKYELLIEKYYKRLADEQKQRP